MIALSVDDAKRTGVNYLAGTRGQVQTANGLATVYMTGFFTIKRGFSFLNASPIAGPTMFQSNSDAGFCVIKVGSGVKKPFRPA